MWWRDSEDSSLIPWEWTALPWEDGVLSIGLLVGKKVEENFKWEFASVSTILSHETGVLAYIIEKLRCKLAIEVLGWGRSD